MLVYLELRKWSVNSFRLSHTDVSLARKNVNVLSIFHRQGASFVEQWNEGHAFSEINKYVVCSSWNVFSNLWIGHFYKF